MKHGFLAKIASELGYPSQGILVAIEWKWSQQLEGEEARVDYRVYSWCCIELWEYGFF